MLHHDGGCSAVTKVVSSPSLLIQRVNIAGAEMICDISSGAVRPVVPATFQRTVFAAVHGLAPPGIKATHRMISRRLSGIAALRTCHGGVETARSASMTRSPSSWRRRRWLYRYQRSGSATFMWIWWGRFPRLQMGSSICSPS